MRIEESSRDPDKNVSPDRSDRMGRTDLAPRFVDVIPEQPD